MSFDATATDTWLTHYVSTKNIGVRGNNISRWKKLILFITKENISSGKRDLSTYLQDSLPDVMPKASVSSFIKDFMNTLNFATNNSASTSSGMINFSDSDDDDNDVGDLVTIGKRGRNDDTNGSSHQQKGGGEFDDDDDDDEYGRTAKRPRLNESNNNNSSSSSNELLYSDLASGNNAAAKTNSSNKKATSAWGGLGKKKTTTTTSTTSSSGWSNGTTQMTNNNNNNNNNNYNSNNSNNNNSSSSNSHLNPRAPSYPPSNTNNNTTNNNNNNNFNNRNAPPQHIQNFMNQQKQQQHQHQQQSRPPPPGYVCKICNIPGHFIQDCPQKLQRQQQKQQQQQMDLSKEPEGEKIERGEITTADSTKQFCFIDINVFGHQKACTSGWPFQPGDIIEYYKVTTDHPTNKYKASRFTLLERGPGYSQKQKDISDAISQKKEKQRLQAPR